MTVAVEGLSQMQKAFQLAGAQVNRGLKVELQAIAEPVRLEAERLAVGEIRNIGSGDPWGQMRTVARRSLVYVAPQQRGRRSKTNARIRRPNLADLLMDRAMQPALERKKEQVVRGIEGVLAKMEGTWARG